ncbi:hypothetical protein BSS2_I0626 [Brucella suis bv. 1 str. S2]|uniref:Uncharacterized protein n=2 Tax=Brucella TaxID=234 RepID=A9MA20_BRUC2|nr:hypothetical protein BR0644 [Brucella suis 1330]ABX61732.1 Hypothetical protein, conserved [Brucella canis ATCC 23365]AEU05658.1 hypothetical protein BSVBI22_A0640 [Brucella suis VBI22]AHN46282.1 hypothetical protein BSS2_I0626 [Brucella suis bv. 1 str. S2]CDL76047.1 unnamed protein product [Brucella canis str. Oliveri]
MVVGAKGRASGVGISGGSDDWASETIGWTAAAMKQPARSTVRLEEIAATFLNMA